MHVIDLYPDLSLSNGRFYTLDECRSLEEAMALVRERARITPEENIKGSIEAGKVADMVVLDRDYFSVPAEEIKDIRVEKTMVAGNIVWERE